MRNLLRSAVVAAAVAAAALPAFAARPDVTRMTCPQAQEFIRRHSPVVVTTGRHTYDMYFAEAYACVGPYQAQRSYVVTRDGVECMIGYTCVPGMWD